MLRSNVLRQFKKILEKVEISDKHTFHNLRHTNATLLLMSRVPLKTASGRLGHSSTAFTQDRYGHILAIMEDEAATAIEEIVPDQRT